MGSTEPRWWYDGDRHRTARLLHPLGAAYGWITTQRMQQPPRYRAKLPVICVGNFTAGGTGKTPFVRLLVSALRNVGHTPAVLSRGYGGHLAGPYRVDPTRDRATDVGDEPLLLASSAPVVIARDRAQGAAAIEQSSDDQPTVIVMDDGLQNPSLRKDLTIALVDAARGFGNGRCLPAGPLRAPLKSQLPFIDAVVLNLGAGGPDGPGLASVFQAAGKPVLSARIDADGDTTWLKGTRVVAYSGIGVPSRFHASLASAGATISDTVAFPDHHTFASQDAERLLKLAQKHTAHLVTTEKDAIRLVGASGALADLRQASRALRVSMRLQDGGYEQLRALIAERIPLRA